FLPVIILLHHKIQRKTGTEGSSTAPLRSLRPQSPQPMGAVSALADVVVAPFSLIMAVAAPLFDSQVVLPRRLYPAPLVDIHQ
uniref:Uncharacterized protein n=2 Tax=Aegilops tauschii subsp. strangulata TaxID=200361 RepID=A0A453E437_AEGTS